MVGGAILMFLLTALLTGLYPAWVISGFKPTNTLRGMFTASMGQNGLRKTLVVAQFSISIIVFVSTIVVWQQLDLMKNKELGYNKSNLLSIKHISWDGKGETFKNELQRISGVVSSSLSNWEPGDGGGNMTRQIEDPFHANQRLNVWYIVGDTDLSATMGFKLMKGRLLSNQYADAQDQDSLDKLDPEETRHALDHESSLMTASAARMLNIKNLDVQANNAHSVPVGIIGDFHNESLYERIKPTLILAQKSPEYGCMFIRTEPNTAAQVTAGIGKLWKQFFPNKLLRIQNIEEKTVKTVRS
jgi:putative ABC transport system permease protein